MKIQNDISASDEKDLTVRSKRLFLFLRFTLYARYPHGVRPPRGARDVLPAGKRNTRWVLRYWRITNFSAGISL